MSIRPLLWVLPPFEKRLHLVISDIELLKGGLDKSVVVADCREFALCLLECLSCYIKAVGEYCHHAFHYCAFSA